MSQSDILFKNMCNEILTNGTYTTSARAVWEDGTPANTIKQFGIINTYDLSKEFPAMTLRPIALKSCIDELLWIYQRKSNNVKDLNSHIWDEWADREGTIGHAYGWQVKNKVRRIDINEGNGHCYTAWLDQIDYVIHELKNNPYSRRIIIDLYSIDDLPKMNLDPCAYNITFNVTEDNGEFVLNAILNQRSQDILAANNWNVVQYSILIHMLAQVCNYKVGKFIHVISDAHIYDKHVDIIKEMINRVPFNAPELIINPDVHDFYEFTVDDFNLIDYKHHDQIKNIPIAI